MAAGIALAAALVAAGVVLTHSPEPNPPSQPDPGPSSSASASSEASTAVAVRDSLGDYTWDELAKISDEIVGASDRDEALDIAAQYNLVGEDGSFEKSTKSVKLESGKKVTAKLVDVLHDDRSNGKGKAGLTFLFDECVASRPMNGIADNSGGWAECSMRSWLKSDFSSQLPKELRSNIVEVNKSTNNAGTTSKKASITVTADKIWLPSVCEICGDTAFIGDHSKSENDAANAVINGEGSQYQAFADMGKTFKPDVEYSQMVRSYKGKATKWWYRTPSPGSTGARFFRAVSEKGDLSDIGYADKDHGVVPGFCI